MGDLFSVFGSIFFMLSEKIPGEVVKGLPAIIGIDDFCGRIEMGKMFH